MGPTLDADAHIFQAASSFWTQKGALDAVSTARRPCAERWGRKERNEKKSFRTYTDSNRGIQNQNLTS